MTKNNGLRLSEIFIRDSNSDGSMNLSKEDVEFYFCWITNLEEAFKRVDEKAWHESLSKMSEIALAKSGNKDEV